MAYGGCFFKISANGGAGYLPRSRNLKGQKPAGDFLRGYAVDFYAGGTPDPAHVVQRTEFNANRWVDEKQVPYTYAPGERFNWVRVRMVGGRSLMYYDKLQI